MLPPSARVLEIGCGAGTFARELAAQGYGVTALTDIEEEWRTASALPEQKALCVLQGLEDYVPSARFDILLLQQSAQYYDPLLLLSRANAWLVDGGQMLIADEFLLDDSVIREESRPLLSNFLRLAERCGFRVERQRELGRQVAPGLLQFAQLLQTQQQALGELLSLPGAALGALHGQLLVLAGNYASARLGYTLLDLRRGPLDASQTVYGNAHSFTLKEVQPLFERSFEVSFNPAVWHWKYGNGRGRAVSARQEGELVAHYGGAPRDILYFGARARAIQICDVMVMPEHRSFVSRDTLFFKTAATFLEQQIGNCAEHLLGFGFPNIRVLRMACRLGLYDVTDSFIEIHYPRTVAETDSSSLHVAPFALDVVSAVDPVAACWTRMAADLRGSIVGLRDLDYLRYRYCSHPQWAEGGYECVAVTGQGNPAPVAIVVLKRLGHERLLMDIIGAVADYPAALEAVRGTLAAGNIGLHCRITRAHAPAVTLPGSDWRDLEIEIPCNIWTRGPAAGTLAGAWWLTAGDMDFL
jgi:SAM-dependent methyltransferase